MIYFARRLLTLCLTAVFVACPPANSAKADPLDNGADNGALEAGGDGGGMARPGRDFRDAVWGMGLAELKQRETAMFTGQEILLDEPEVLLLHYGAAQLLGRQGRPAYFLVDGRLFSAIFVIADALAGDFQNLCADMSKLMGSPLKRGQTSCSWAAGRLRVRAEFKSAAGRQGIFIWVFPSETIVASQFADYQDVIAVHSGW